MQPAHLCKSTQDHESVSSSNCYCRQWSVRASNARELSHQTDDNNALLSGRSTARRATPEIRDNSIPKKMLIFGPPKKISNPETE